MSNINSPHRYDSSFIEATVLHVDPVKFICSVKTINGKLFQEVKWLLPTGGYTESGMHFTPNVQDRVLISTSLGYPLILGCIPRVGTYNGETTSVTGATSTPDIGSDSNMGKGVSANPSKPSDFLPGDFMYTARGGSLLAVLSSGIAILKASSLAQIVMSKFEGLVRIVTRNYQRFSDSSSRVSTNMKGRLYEWFGADWDITHNRQSNERYQELYGDVAAGEVLKGVPDPDLVLPAQDTRIRKQWLRDVSGNVIMIETLYDDGSITFVVQNGAGSIKSTTTSKPNGEWKNLAEGGGNTTSITVTPSLVSIVSSVEAEVTAPSIKLGGGGTLTKLVKDTAIEVFNNHTHLYSPGPGTPTPTATPAVPMTTSNATSILEAE